MSAGKTFQAFVVLLALICLIYVFVAIFDVVDWRLLLCSSIGLWIFMELLFILFVRYRFGVSRFGMDQFPEMSKDAAAQLVREVCDRRSTPDLRKYLEGWFQGVNFNEIGEEHMMEWILGICFNERPETADKEKLASSRYIMNCLEENLGHKFERKNTKLPMMLLALDPPKVAHRPILFYSLTASLGYRTERLLKKSGFVRYDDGELITYALQRHSKDSETIAFFHGVGIGLVPYSGFILSLKRHFPNRSIILFEMPHVSMKLASTHCYPREYADLMAERCRKLRITSFTAIGHSLGTISIRWLDLYHPNLINGRVFLDPVCFALWTHHVAYNFLYREPKNTVQKVIKYVVSMEPGIVLHFRRFFVWYENTYFSDQLPENSVIYLAEKDAIMNAKFICNYLQNFPSATRKVKMFPGARHGQFLMDDFGEIFEDIGDLSKSLDPNVCES